MAEETYEDRERGEDTSPGGGEDPITGQDPIDGQGGEGRAKERATPPLTEQGEPGQTRVPAPDDDVGGQRGGEDRPE